MQDLTVTNGSNKQQEPMQMMAIDCVPPPPSGLLHRRQQSSFDQLQQQQQQENGLPSSASSSSTSSMEAGLNGIGQPQQEQQQQTMTPKRSKLKKGLHLDLLSISNCHNAGNNTGAFSPSSERLGGGGGILSPWNQPQFQPRRAQRPSKLFPVHIMPYLYLGNDDTAKNRETLDKCGIRYVVNVTSDLPNYFAAGDQQQEQMLEGGENGRPPIEYMRIPVDDNCSHNLAQFFPAAISFIEKARSEGASVLVHCWAGISRSVTVCLAYLMYSLHCTLEEAFDRLLKQNGTIAPNFHFMEALTCWERDLFASAAGFSASAGLQPPPHSAKSFPAKSPTAAAAAAAGPMPMAIGGMVGGHPPRSPSSFGSQLGLAEAQTAAN